MSGDHQKQQQMRHTVNTPMRGLPYIITSPAQEKRMHAVSHDIKTAQGTGKQSMAIGPDHLLNGNGC